MENEDKKRKIIIEVTMNEAKIVQNDMASHFETIAVLQVLLNKFRK